MIQFNRLDKPLVMNRKCALCVEECKQHADVIIIACPSFKPSNKAQSSVGERIDFIR